MQVGHHQRGQVERCDVRCHGTDGGHEAGQSVPSANRIGGFSVAWNP